MNFQQMSRRLINAAKALRRQGQETDTSTTNERPSGIGFRI